MAEDKKTKSESEISLPGLDQFEAVLGQLGKMGVAIAAFIASVTAATATVLNPAGQQAVGQVLGGFQDAFRRLWNYIEGQGRDLAGEVATIYAAKWAVFPLWCIFWSTVAGTCNLTHWLGIFIPFLIITYWQAALFIRHAGLGAVTGFLYGMLKGLRNPLRSIDEAFSVVRDMMLAGKEGAREVLSQSVVKVWAEHSWWVIVAIYAMMAPYHNLPKGMMIFPALLSFYLVLGNTPVPWGNRDADHKTVRNKENKPQMPTAHRYLTKTAIALLFVFPVVAWLRFDPDGPGKLTSIWSAVFGGGIVTSPFNTGNAMTRARWSYESRGATFFVTMQLLSIVGFITIARRSVATRITLGVLGGFVGWLLAPDLGLWWLIVPAVCLAIFSPRRAAATA